MHQLHPSSSCHHWFLQNIHTKISKIDKRVFEMFQKVHVCNPTIRCVSLDLLATTGHNSEWRGVSWEGGKPSHWGLLNSERGRFKGHRCHHWGGHFQLRLIVAASANASSLVWKTKQVPLIIIKTIVAKDLWLVFWHVAWHLWQTEGYDNVNIIWTRSIFHLQTKIFKFIFIESKVDIPSGKKHIFSGGRKRRDFTTCVCVF